MHDRAVRARRRFDQRPEFLEHVFHAFDQFGAVAAAIEGAFFDITSVAVSLEFDPHAQFDKAARLARQIIEQILRCKSPASELYNLNIPTPALSGVPQVKIVPMGLEHYGEHYVKRQDPRGRDYFWATGDPPPQAGEQETDLTALMKGFVTLTPLQYEMTKYPTLREMEQWDLQVEE